jgi:hypothetical protein
MAVDQAKRLTSLRLGDRGTRKAQAIFEFVFFLPVFFILFIFFLWFHWGTSGSIVHQQGVRRALFGVYNNSPSFIRSQLESNSGAPLPYNNFFVGYSAVDVDSNPEEIVPNFPAFFGSGGFSDVGTIQIRTSIGICLETLWTDPGTVSPLVATETTYANQIDPIYQDPYKTCR